jgi:hypothetical protein
LSASEDLGSEKGTAIPIAGLTMSFNWDAIDTRLQKQNEAARMHREALRKQQLEDRERKHLQKVSFGVDEKQKLLVGDDFGSHQSKSASNAYYGGNKDNGLGQQKAQR